MKALVLERIKQPLVYKDIQAVNPIADQVQVSLRAAGLNRRDYWITQGQYPGIGLPAILGSDGVGEYLGSDYLINPNINWGPDDKLPGREYEILGLSQQGTFAQAITVPRHRLHPKPAHLSDIEAAALPLAGLTAYRALFNREKGHWQTGKKVLITGIGGGVAHLVLLFAAAVGAEVFVTSGSDEKIAQAVRLGAQGGAKYRSESWVKTLRREAGTFDLIIDSAGGSGFGQLVHLCNRGARIVFYGATAGHWQGVDAPRLFLKQITLVGSTMGSDREFTSMLAFVEEHQIRPIVDEVYSLKEGNQALQRMAQGNQFGKLVLCPLG